MNLPPHTASFAAQPSAPNSQDAQNASPKQRDDDFAIMRDTNWRYGGFADEVGEIAKPYLGEAGRIAGYGISGVYCLADLFITAKQMNQRGQHLSNKERRKKVAIELFDLAIFHAVATMLVPPLLIGKGVHWAEKYLSPKHPKEFEQATKLVQGAGKLFGKTFNADEAKHLIQTRLRKPLPVLVGIGLVPVIAHPFDLLMEKVQDWTTRLLFGKHKVILESGGYELKIDKNGQQQMVVKKPRFRSIPRDDFWTAKDKQGRPVVTQDIPSRRTSTHRHDNKHDTKPLHQPHVMRDYFGEWAMGPAAKSHSTPRHPVTAILRETSKTRPPE